MTTAACQLGSESRAESGEIRKTSLWSWHRSAVVDEDARLVDAHSCLPRLAPHGLQ